ncbi:MAG: GGDEF domain-containing protein [Treponema sp.]|nr:GGDEF domain-containing protein [Treponema sp.]
MPFTLSISIGTVEYSSNHNDLSELLKAADKNLYEEKKIKHAQRDKA